MRRVLALLLALPLSASVVAAPSPAPPTRDVTVKTEQRLAPGRGARTTTIATYFSGTRQRREAMTRGASLDADIRWVTITQCDERRTLILNPESRLYAYMPHEAPAFRRLIQPVIAVPRPNPSGRKVIIAIDAVDTGERRQVGSYVARHVKTTTTQSGGCSEKRIRQQSARAAPERLGRKPSGARRALDS
jgi:hypothetical protein